MYRRFVKVKPCFFTFFYQLTENTFPILSIKQTERRQYCDQALRRSPKQHTEKGRIQVHAQRHAEAHDRGADTEQPPIRGGLFRDAPRRGQAGGGPARYAVGGEPHHRKFLARLLRGSSRLAVEKGETGTLVPAGESLRRWDCGAFVVVDLKVRQYACPRSGSDEKDDEFEQTSPGRENPC